MADRRPLVLISGTPQELPAGDTVASTQPLDTDLTTIAGLTATTNNFIVAVSSAWASRTVAQVKATLALDNVDNTSNATERTATRTLSGARITKRVVQVSNTTSWTIDSDAVDYAENTGLTGNVTLNNPTGTPTVGQTLWASITGTASRTISYGTAFEDSTVIRPTTTSGTAPIDIGFRWNSATSKWRCVAMA